MTNDQRDYVLDLLGDRPDKVLKQRERSLTQRRKPKNVHDKITKSGGVESVQPAQEIHNSGKAITPMCEADKRLYARVRYYLHDAGSYELRFERVKPNK